MSKDTLEKTVAYNSEAVRVQRINEILSNVKQALDERGYQSVAQISGYLISNDPAYISSHKGARVEIQEVERYEIIEELVRFYLDEK